MAGIYGSFYDSLSGFSHCAKYQDLHSVPLCWLLTGGFYAI
jgi:hypothetical protein